MVRFASLSLSLLLCHAALASAGRGGYRTLRRRRAESLSEWVEKEKVKIQHTMGAEEMVPIEEIPLVREGDRTEPVPTGGNPPPKDGPGARRPPKLEEGEEEAPPPGGEPLEKEGKDETSGKRGFFKSGSGPSLKGMAKDLEENEGQKGITKKKTTRPVYGGEKNEELKVLDEKRKKIRKVKKEMKDIVEKLFDGDADELQEAEDVLAELDEEEQGIVAAEMALIEELADEASEETST